MEILRHIFSPTFLSTSYFAFLFGVEPITISHTAAINKLPTNPIVVCPFFKVCLAEACNSRWFCTSTGTWSCSIMISGGGMNLLALKIHGVTPWLAFRINGDTL